MLAQTGRETLYSRMHVQSPTTLDASKLHIGIAVSRYHVDITDSMCRAATDIFIGSGGNQHNLHVVEAPGAFELTAICRALAVLHDRTGRPSFDALVALGCVITGETNHDEYLADSVVQGLTAITVETGIPIAFGVLTCQSIDQARARSSTTGKDTNKGAEAMTAAIQSATTIKLIQTFRAFR
jgi:6,7-dimethyl-8-ribityllumazine synthase